MYLYHQPLNITVPSILTSEKILFTTAIILVEMYYEFYHLFCQMYIEPNKSSAVFYQAVHNCPWSKVLHTTLKCFMYCIILV